MVTIQIQFVVIAVGFEMQLALKGHMTPPHALQWSQLLFTPLGWKPGDQNATKYLLVFLFKW